jgi:hypothetical protein
MASGRSTLPIDAHRVLVVTVAELEIAAAVVLERFDDALR